MKLIQKIALYFSLLLVIVTNTNAQLEFPEDKVSWKFSVEQNGEDATIIATITTVEHWHINAITLPAGSFGFPSSFDLIPSSNFKTIGKAIEPKPIEKFDELADELLAYHEGTFKFKRKIKVLSEKDFEVKGKFAFQTCNEVKCLPDHTVEFSVKVKGVEKKEENTSTEIIEDNNSTENLTEPNESSDENVDENNEVSNENNVNETVQESSKVKTLTEGMSLWAIFFLSLGSGFLALLTPCVFPMIPMTVSFFTKQSKTKAEGIKNAWIYGLSIIAIYVLLGVIVIVTKAAEALNNMSTNPWFNLAFFALLVVFAISFLGAFEIRLPNSWVNKADAKADKGGIVGIFFMALVLALVSFSCTGPIVGSVLVEASRNGGILPLVAMFGFGLALALPFTLFAMFPGWLNSMPSSGGWLNTVKVVLGFIELALAFKFLSNADLAWQSHFLEREVFIAIWIAIFGVLALYLFGKIMLPHDSPVDRLSVGRALFGTLILSFTIYMIPGLWGAPLKIINAFPPPMHYSESPLGVGGGGQAAPSADHVDGMHLGPQNIYAFDDYDKALKYAKEVNKPLFVDFTGWNCVNCRKMEESVWGEPGIIEYLRDSVVIVSLHVDERTDLPKEEQYEADVDGRKFEVTTVGDKWMLMEIKNYATASQPFYIMQTPDGKDLNNGSADFQNHSNPDKFKQWLEDGFKDLNK